MLIEISYLGWHYIKYFDWLVAQVYDVTGLRRDKEMSGGERSIILQLKNN